MAVTGGLSFVQVDVGMLHVCARTAANLAYCWGDSFDGETGTKDGVYYFETAPAPVLGPL